jgi:hypothetical protein
MKAHIRINENSESKYSSFILNSYFYANQLSQDLPEWLMTMESMSGRKYKNFINRLISEIPDARYLEVGTWTGSTACSAMYKNNVNCFFVDNWDQFNPMGNVKNLFFEHTQKIKQESPQANYSFLENDFRKVPYQDIGKYNVYFFDGPHEEKDQYDGVVYAQPALEDEFIFICDDWNWHQVRAGTAQAFSDLGIDIRYSLEVRTTLDGSTPQVVYETSDWHNGYFIASCKKK